MAVQMRVSSPFSVVSVVTLSCPKWGEFAVDRSSDLRVGLQSGPVFLAPHVLPQGLVNGRLVAATVFHTVFEPGHQVSVET